MLATTSDNKIGHDSSGVAIYYIAEALTQNDYYSFGMLIPGRTYSAQTGYRYGFNGKENDNDIKGNGNELDFGNRIYDPRTGRWLSVDPLQSKYAGLAPYIFVGNSPLNAIDPDGKLIIFINGLWGPPMKIGKGGTEDYWSHDWVKSAQDAIGDHDTPRYYDGSIGGTYNLANNRTITERRYAGYAAGYRDAQSIIDKLDKDETIKIVTNSMGAAFERGFTIGLLQYQSEENKRRTAFNADIDKQLSPLYQQKQFLEDFNKQVPTQSMTGETKKKLANDLNDVNSKISSLEAQKKEILNVQVEMVIDLSSHQVDYADPLANSSYYMTAGKENMNFWERTFVDEKAIKGAKSLGTMDVHHSSGADPKKLPSAKNRN